MIFPKGLLHFQKNVAKSAPASVIAAFDSQLPGTQSLVSSLFGALPEDILVKSFQFKPKQVKKIKSRYQPKKRDKNRKLTTQSFSSCFVAPL
ncbi:hypothetical protein DY000_02038488 [Brassica cretica]|uniref:Cupin type-1 domain-containing protein n=1 Tax=Brassica cretica TaxID=69181 RepID=A0ABQ7BMC6_BRACR|nr:hypothetical protein DY000_02038488 [Brassica cretica]